MGGDEVVRFGSSISESDWASVVGFKNFDRGRESFLGPRLAKVGKSDFWVWVVDISEFVRLKILEGNRGVLIGLYALQIVVVETELKG